MTRYWMFPLCIIPRRIPWPVGLSLCTLCKHLEWVICLFDLFPASLSLHGSGHLLKRCNESASYYMLQVFLHRMLRSHFEPKAADLATSRKMRNSLNIHSTQNSTLVPQHITILLDRGMSTTITYLSFARYHLLQIRAFGSLILAVLASETWSRLQPEICCQRMGKSRRATRIKRLQKHTG